MCDRTAILASLRARCVQPRLPPHAYFVVSAVFHYLGPGVRGAAVRARRRARRGVAADRLGGADLRRVAAAVAGVAQRLDRAGRRLLLAWGAVACEMNVCFYKAIDRLPLGTVAAIEFLPVIVARGARRAHAAQRRRARARRGRRLPADGRAARGRAARRSRSRSRTPSLFALYIVLADRVAQAPAARRHRRPRRGDADRRGRASRRSAAGRRCPRSATRSCCSPASAWASRSSVIPYVADQLALARLARATYALLVALLPATATVIGIVVLAQIPTRARGRPASALVVAGVALHREPRAVCGLTAVGRPRTLRCRLA